ncbi:hypothetical protein UlMin_005109 [Ulmus minor]
MATKLLLPLAIFFFSNQATSETYNTFSKHISSKKLGLKQEKLTHLHFYLQDIVSGRHPTAIKVAGAKTSPTSPTDFGFIWIADDALTVNPYSRVIGRAQGLYAAASQSEVGLLMAFDLVFTQGKYNGSSLSLLGRNAIRSEVREMPIIGGSGLFRFARGYALANTYAFNATSEDAIVEYNVYVFHY